MFCGIFAAAQAPTAPSPQPAAPALPSLPPPPPPETPAPAPAPEPAPALAPAPSGSHKIESEKSIGFWNTGMLSTTSIRTLDETIEWPDLQMSSDFYKNVNWNAPMRDRANQLREAVNNDCKDILDQYEKFVRTHEKIYNLDISFSSICRTVKSQLQVEEVETNPDLQHLILKNGHGANIRRFDLTYFNMVVSFAHYTVVESEALEKAYKSSILGKIGVPYKSHFMVTQAIILVLLLMLIVLIGKELTKS
jgi:hypothetical protein